MPFQYVCGYVAAVEPSHDPHRNSVYILGLVAKENADTHDRDRDGIGRFAHLDDPEGNAIELWEPATA